MPESRHPQTCAAHGLHFDPGVSSGCVLCRNSQRLACEGRRQRWPAIVVVVGLLGLASAIVFGLWQRGNRARSTATGVIEVGGLSAQPVASQASGVRTSTSSYVGPPALRPLFDDGQRCHSGDEAACTRFLSTCLSAGAYPVNAYAPNRNRAMESMCVPSYRILTRRCERDEVEACAQLAKTSTRMQERACELGHAESCKKLVRPSFEEEQEEARERLRCETGDGATCVRLAAEREAQTPPDTKGAEELLRKGCRDGYKPACDSLDERAARASRQAQQECDAGGHEACLLLARHYAGTKGGDTARKDELVQRALAILERSCRAGDRTACRELSIQLLGAGDEQATRGRTQLDAACHAGEELSCWALAEYFGVAFGRPETQDRPLSRQYYALALPLSEAACERGDAEACERAALVHGAGFGVPLDRVKADTLLARAIQLVKASSRRAQHD